MLNAAESISQTGKGDGRITVTLGTSDKNGAEMSEFVVTDNGAGIADDDFRHIFESGYSTKEGDHSGLGLHWSADTLIAAKGTIYAENRADETGACFHVLMPVTK